MNSTRNIKGSLNLFDLISYRWFRTVEDKTCPGSSNEYLINIDLKDPFRNALSFKTPYHGQLYAYAFVSKNMQKLFDDYGFTQHEVMVDLCDWDDRFLLSFEQGNKEVQFFVKSEDVKYVLEHCMRIPAQRLKNEK